LAGKLIAIEGLDGTGKSTQIRLLKNWLETEGWPTEVFKRKTSKLVAQKINEAKKEKALTPLTYSLIHAADFSEIYLNEVVPALKAGFVVIFNKYVYTSIAKDFIRGNDKSWVKELYEFACIPDLTVYFKANLEQALENMTQAEKERDFYDSGMDLGIASSSLKSLQVFQQKLMDEYEEMAQNVGFKVISNQHPIQDVQAEFRKTVSSLI
jgi:dTMP kinase